MNVLFVPSIGLDVSLLERLAASIDYPIKWKVAFNNGPSGALDAFGESHPDWIVKEPRVGNRGVAGSWNDCAKMFHEEQSWLLMNEDAYFLPGYLKKICEAADVNLDAPCVFLNHTCAFYCFVWTAAGRKELGEFDENFWPAYYEDYDYRLRLEFIKGLPPAFALPDNPPLPHGKPRSGGTDYAALIQGTGLLNRQYWRRKWGNLEFKNPAYSTPYKDQRLGASEWVWYPEHRAKLHPLWEAFMEQEPSIYD